ncbi:MAG TPA: glycine zipper family protein, partial [Stellaceae bacterium]|nr:glycine zipper family protein [Stellaceae bacterium]
MKPVGLWVAAGLAAVSLSACVGPLGPTVPVAPGPGKSFDAFAADQATCEQYAEVQVGPQAAYANNRAVGSALLGTALGAGL